MARAGQVGVFALKTPGQGEPGVPLLQCQEDVALAAEVHQVAAFERPNWLRRCAFVGRWWIGVRLGIGGLAASVATPPAALRLALRERAGTARLPAGL